MGALISRRLYARLRPGDKRRSIVPFRGPYWHPQNTTSSTCHQLRRLFNSILFIVVDPRVMYVLS